MKCHRCPNEVVKAWHRGEFIYCSSECRDEAWKAGEPLYDPKDNPEDWVDIGGGDQVYFKRSG